MIEIGGRLRCGEAVSAATSAVAPGIFCLQRVLRPSWQQSSSHQIQVGQCKQRERSHRVLEQTAIAHHRESPQPLHYAESKLATGAPARTTAIDCLLVVAQRATPLTAPVDALRIAHTM